MIPLWMWGLILDGTGLLGSYYLARLNRVGWIVSLVAQVLWAVYSVQTKQWGFFPGIALQTFINVKGYKNWKRHGDEPEVDHSPMVEEVPDVVPDPEGWVQMSLLHL